MKRIINKYSANIKELGYKKIIVDDTGFTFIKPLTKTKYEEIVFNIETKRLCKIIDRGFFQEYGDFNGKETILIFRIIQEMGCLNAEK